MLGEHEVSIKGMAKDKVEGGLVEAEGSLFVTIVEDQEIMPETAQIQCDCHATIVLSWTMRLRITLYCWLRFMKRKRNLHNQLRTYR